MSSRIARCPLNVLRLVDAVTLAVAEAGHSFLRSQWAIPVSALVVCSTLTCRINVSGFNVALLLFVAQRAMFVIFYSK